MSNGNMGQKFTPVTAHHKYYDGLNPLVAQFCLQYHGFACPDFTAAPACEFAVQTGDNILIHATSGNSQWYGVESDPSLLNETLHSKRRNKLELELSFSALNALDEIASWPQFAFIGVNGDWCKLEKSSQEAILNFVKAHLQVGGVFYLSYSSATSLQSMQPFQELLQQYAATEMPAAKAQTNAFKDIALFLGNVAQANPLYLHYHADAFPKLVNLLQSSEKDIQSSYLTPAWNPSFFNEIVHQLASSDLSFACSANYARDLNNSLLESKEHSWIKRFAGTPLLDVIVDSLALTSNRCDYFIRTEASEKDVPAIATPMVTGEALLAMQRELTMVSPVLEPDLANKMQVQTLTEQEQALMIALMELMGDTKVRSLGEICDTLAQQGFKAEECLATIANLIYLKLLAPAKRLENVSKEVKERCQRFNKNLLQEQRFKQVISLASPVKQGAVEIDQMLQILLFIYCREPKIKPANLAKAAAKILVEQKAYLQKDDSIVSTLEELSELLQEREVEKFFSKMLPFCKSLLLV